MKKFSTSWKRSKKPGKQRKYSVKAPLHLKKDFVSAHLSPELRKKYGKRNLSLRKGDKVKILKGNFRKKEGKIERIDRKRNKIYVTGIETTKKDGSKVMKPVDPSNLMILELNLDDKKRKSKLEK